MKNSLRQLVGKLDACDLNNFETLSGIAQGALAPSQPPQLPEGVRINAYESGWVHPGIPESNR